AVFYGTPIQRDADISPGRHPVILLSHGWGGNYGRMAWLSAGLASEGAIVVAVNHPNSTTFDLNYESALHHWTRPQDLAAALDHVLEDDAFAPFIDDTRIYAAGFSYGGWTALSLGGMEARREGVVEYCAAAGAQSQFCAELAREGLDISALDQGLHDASYKDARVRAVAAIDPGLTWGLQEDDVANVVDQVLLLGLGDGADRLHATDTSPTGSNLEALLPESAVKIIAPATHFSALGLCKPAGEIILVEEGDDPVCTDPDGTNRGDVLREIVAHVSDHFELN
ncbi:MAG: hypothetical protein AAGI50_00835, partial [Pseudomonadota bacterium]